MEINNSAVETYVRLLRQQGVSDLLIPYIIAQIAHESRNFTDKKIITHNNPTGVTWANKPYQKASKGNVLPETANTAHPVYYAKFASLQDWCADYLRILNRKPYPLKATSLSDYAIKLRQSGYYTDTLTNYLKGLQNWYAHYNTTVQAALKGSALLVPVLILAALILFAK